jgi:hypothetical protein
MVINTFRLKIHALFAIKEIAFKTFVKLLKLFDQVPNHPPLEKGFGNPS